MTHWSTTIPARQWPLLQLLRVYACSKRGLGAADLAVGRLGTVGEPTPADTSGTD